MIFRLEWRVAILGYSGPGLITAARESIATTDISNIYAKIDEITRDDTERLQVTKFEVFEEKTGELVTERPFFYNDKEQDANALLVRWLADFARKNNDIKTTSWVTDAINKYDTSNPTIKSLIYSLWINYRGDENK